MTFPGGMHYVRSMRFCFVLFGALLFGPALPGLLAQDQPTPTPAVDASPAPPEPSPDPAATPQLPEPTLTAADLEKAETLDSVSVPTPGEFFTAIERHGKPSWNTQFREPIPTNFTRRTQLALNLGGLVADGYIAVAAQDSQQVKNIGRDIIAIAKALGVSQNVLSRGNSITSFAENNEWEALKEELEATQNEVKQAMDEQQDQELVTLVSLGAWIRATQVVSGLVVAEYTPERAELLRQPALLGYLRGKLAELSPRLAEDELITTIDGHLAAMQDILASDLARPLDAAQITQLHDNATKLVTALLARPSA